MPELPEIETLRLQLKPKLEGSILSRLFIFHEDILGTSREDLERQLPGKKILSLSRRGKYLALNLEGAMSLWFHLGMTGQLVWDSDTRGHDPRAHLAIEFEEVAEKLIFRDVRKFGVAFLTNAHPQSFPEGLRLLGPEPFDVDENAFARFFKSRRARIKSLLLNQRVIAGLGNIYADESLHRAGIDPRRRSCRIPRGKLGDLYRAVRETLSEAIRHGGSSIDDYLHPDGRRGSFQHFHRVYGRFRERCLSCRSIIRRIRIAGRSSFFCPQCQK